MKSCIKRIISLIILGAFFVNSVVPPSYAQSLPNLPAPGTMLPLSATYSPAVITGMTIHPENPLQFDFIVDSGDDQIQGEALKIEAQKMINYFMATLTVPENEMWVNLSPYEKNRIIADGLSKTEMGRDMLAQDYLLKQLTASLIYPEEGIGKEFWSKIYEKAQAKFGTTDIPTNLFNKVWIVPEEASVYVHGHNVFVTNSHLKVMLEQDYVALNMAMENTALSNEGSSLKDIETIEGASAQVIREIILPAIEKEVNEGKNFANLRQIYHSMILATWYKKQLKDSLFEEFYLDQNKTNGIELEDKNAKEKIYGQYLEAFKKGVYDYIKEEYDAKTQEVVNRKYFSGGLTKPADVVDQASLPEGYLTEANRNPDFIVRVNERILADGMDGRSSDGDRPSDAMLSKVYDAPTPQQQFFVKQVLEAVLGVLPSHVKITYGENGHSEQFILIEHDEVEPFSQKTVHFRYGIELDSGDVLTPDVVSFDDVNVMQVPMPATDGYSGSIAEEMQYALKRMLIADPLNPRFGKEIKLDKYQRNAVRNNLEAFKTGNKAMDVMATATGKTVVAFHTMHEYLDGLPEGDRGAVLFIVNNNIILGEAEDKLHDMFPGKYTSSRIYEGEADYSGKVIFATPTSLDSKGRIEELLKQQKISMVIFDEVHHVPAPIIKGVYRRFEEESERQQWKTKFLGFTATEVRSDRVSVLRLFDKNIAFEYPIRQARAEGALVPMMYLDGDQDINPEGVGPIIPGHPLYEKYYQERYSNDRFDHLVELYLNNSKELLDKRGLILAPNVERSQSLAGYFKRRGIAAVSLTADDRTKDPLRFEHSYKAWKKGKWPEGSPYSQEPVPQVVVAVDIFKEGIDVPAINLVMLWVNTDSTVQFMQSIGRGLRMAPYKSHLVVVDAIGLFRKVHLLRFLGGVFTSGKEGREKKKKKEGIGGGIKVDDRKEDIDEEKPVQKGRKIVLASSEVTKVLDAYLDALPDHLLYRYGTYSEFPAKVLIEALDPWLAREAEFLKEERIADEEVKKGVKAMYGFFGEFAEKLVNDQASAEELVSFRARFMMAFRHSSFFYDKFRDMSDANIYSDYPSTLVVFLRLYELFNMGRADTNQVTLEHMYKMFPEFDPKIKLLRQNRGENLKMMRTLVFDKSPVDILREFLKIYKNTMNYDTPDEDKGFSIDFHFREWEDALRQFDGGDIKFLGNLLLSFDLAEGKLEKRRKKELAEYYLESKEERESGRDEDQNLLMFLYLNHPNIKKTSLVVEDFELAPAEFKKKLEVLGLGVEGISLQQLTNRLREVISSYEEAVYSKDQGRIDRSAFFLREVLSSQRNLTLLDPTQMNKSIANNFLGFLERLKAALNSFGDQARNEDREIVTLLEEYLRRGGIIWKENVDGLEGVFIEVKNNFNDPEEFSVAFQSTHPQHAEMMAVPALSVVIKEDLTGRKHMLLTSSQINNLQKLHSSLNEDDRRALIDSIVSALEGLIDIYGESSVFVVSEDPAGSTFWSEIFQSLLDTTDFNVLGQLKTVRYEESRERENLNFTFEGTSRSRLSFLNDLDISSIKRFAPHSGDFTVAGRLNYLYQVLYDYWFKVRPGWDRVVDKIQAFRADQTLDQKAIEHFLPIIEKQIVKDVTGPKRMGALKTILKLLDADFPLNPLSSEQIRFVDLYLIVAFELYVKEGYRERSTVFAIIQQYLAIIEIARSNGQEIPSDLKTKINDFVNLALGIFLGQQPYSFNLRTMGDSLLKELGYHPLKRMPMGTKKINAPIFPSAPIIPSATSKTTDPLPAEKDPSVSPTQPVSVKPIVTITERTLRNVRPPYFIQHPDLLKGGDTDYYLGLWVEETVDKKGNRKKGEKPVVHWDKQHADEVARTNPSRKMTLKTRLELMFDRSTGHTLCKICRSSAEGATAGTPFFGTWENYEVDHKKGNYKGHELDPETGELKKDKEDAAMVVSPETPGGIDFNPQNLNLKEQGSLRGINFSFENFQNIPPNTVNGILPVIINIVPVTNLPQLLGLSSEKEPQQFSQALN